MKSRVKGVRATDPEWELWESAARPGKLNTWIKSSLNDAAKADLRSRPLVRAQELDRDQLIAISRGELCPHGRDPETCLDYECKQRRL